MNPQYPGDTNSTYSGTEGATNEVEPLEELTIVMPAEGTSTKIYNRWPMKFEIDISECLNFKLITV